MDVRTSRMSTTRDGRSGRYRRIIDECRGAVERALRECEMAMEREVEDVRRSARRVAEASARDSAVRAQRAMETAERCVDALRKVKDRNDVRWVIRAWRSVAMDGRCRRARDEEAWRARRVRDAFERWRATAKARAKASRVGMESTVIDKGNDAYAKFEESCDSAVEHLARLKGRKPRRGNDDVRHAFMRGVCALNLEALDVL